MVKAVISPASRRDFLRDVAAFQKQTGKSVENVMDMVGVSCARQLMTKTLPIGLKATGPRSGESFQSSIMAQVHRALKKNITAFRNGESAESIHARARSSRGVVDPSPRDKQNARIPYNTRAMNHAGGVDLEVKAFNLAAKMQKRAGMAKAAWLKAMEDIGVFKGGKVPQYVRRHKNNAKGYATQRGRGLRGYHITLVNDVAHMNSRLCPPNMIASALRIGYGVIAWELDKVLHGGKPTKITLRKKR